MKTDWITKFIIETNLIENSFLSQMEYFVLNAYLIEKKNIREIAEETRYSDNKVRHLIENSFGKIFLTIKDLIAKSFWLQKTLSENDALTKELSFLKNKYKKQIAKEQQLIFNFDQAHINIDNLRFCVRAKNILKNLEIKTLGDLAKLNMQNLNSKEKVGVKTVNEIVCRAEEYGIKIT